VCAVILEHFLCAEPETPNLKMEDAEGSSHTFMEGKTVQNTARKKKRHCGNALLFTIKKNLLIEL
jgi:hypothetical protein